MLVDTTVIYVSSGKGGDGCVAFRREAYVPKGGPNGGDGGDGGSVILLAQPGVDTLLDLAGRHHWTAESGQPGGPKQCHGRNGSDLVIPVPPGTLVFDDESGQRLADLDAPGAQVVVARGGRGGFGNEHFKRPDHQVPRESTPGEPAEQRTLRLELKLIADIGLIGKPNAGKSTLLSRLSAARPRIGDYPFTTLEPQLGIAEMPGARRLVVADIPGLIEGAAGGAGLGVQFLRHIERTRALVHVLELEPTDGSDPADNYRAIRAELAAYAPALADKPELVVVNKVDLLGDEADAMEAADLLRNAIDREVTPISGATGHGVADLLEACWMLAGRAPGEDWTRA